MAILKTAVIDDLYQAGAQRVVKQMGEHVYQVLRGLEISEITEETIDRIAKLNGKEGRRGMLVLASKLAHFFVDPERFPIFDSRSERMLRKLRGRQTTYASYVVWARDFEEVRAGIVPRCSIRDLDRFLWIADMLDVWKRSGSEAKINLEVLALFQSEDPAVSSLLRDME